MTVNTGTIIAIITASILTLLVFVRPHQLRRAVLACLIAQLFSWPVTLLYVQLGLQENPVRLFPHATASNFLFAFIFHPSVFVAFYLHYPYRQKKTRRMVYTALCVAIPIGVQVLTSLYTDIIHIPHKLSILLSYTLLFFLYQLSRAYLDHYFQAYLSPKV